MRKRRGKGRWRSCSERKCQLLSFWEEKISLNWAEVWGEDNGGDNNGRKRLLLILILDATILHFHFTTFYQDTNSLSLSLFLSLSLYFLSPPPLYLFPNEKRKICMLVLLYIQKGLVHPTPIHSRDTIHNV